MTAVLNPFLVDCDTGRDDALALWLCCRMGLPLKGVVCSFGNTPLSNVIVNNVGVLSVAGRGDIPVWPGADKALRHHSAFDSIVLPRHLAGGNGVCNISLPSDRPLPSQLSPMEIADHIRTLVEEAGRLDYIVLGPATNLAGICEALGDGFKDCIQTVYMGGGKFDWMWPQVPGADFNVVADPFAVDFLLRKGIEIRFVPMDVLFPVFSTLDEIQALKPCDDVSRYAKEIMMAHALHFSPQPVFRHIDPATILSCINPEGFLPKKLGINLDESSPDFGRLTEESNGCPVFVYQRYEERFTRFKEDILKKIGFENP